jgi:hypothetical protein
VTEGNYARVFRCSLKYLNINVSSAAVNVLRMIKLFGWEGKIAARIKEKRVEELAWLWKLKVRECVIAICLKLSIERISFQRLEALNSIIKYV